VIIQLVCHHWNMGLLLYLLLASYPKVHFNTVNVNRKKKWLVLNFKRFYGNETYTLLITSVSRNCCLGIFYRVHFYLL